MYLQASRALDECMILPSTINTASERGVGAWRDRRFVSRVEGGGDSGSAAKRQQKKGFDRFHKP